MTHSFRTTGMIRRAALRCLTGAALVGLPLTGSAGLVEDAFAENVARRAATFSSAYNFADPSLLTASEQLEFVSAANSTPIPGCMEIMREPAGGFTFGIDNQAGYAAVVKYQGTEDEITIPDEVDFDGKTYPVTKIWTNAFVAFTGSTINFGKNIEEIMTQSFAMCTKLSKVNLNEGLKKIGDSAFYLMCSNVKSMEFPSTLETIGEQSFRATKISGEIVIPKSLTSIGGGAFMGNPITGFYICEEGNPNFSAKDGVLYSKDGSRLVMMPPGMVETKTVIPDGVKEIDMFALYGNSILQEVVIPSSVEKIGERAFANCNLKTFHVGPALKETGIGFVCANKNLESITVDPANSVFKTEGNYLINTATRQLAAATYFTGDFIVPDGVEEVTGYVGYQNKNLTSFKAPASVRKIGKYAFDNCSGLTSIEFPGVEEIGDYSFQHANHVPAVTLPTTLKKIGQTAFAYMEGLTEITIPEGTEEMGRAIFYGCKNLKKCSIPGSVKSYGDAIFYQCVALEEASLGEGMPYIPDQLFNFCSALSKVNIPSTIEYIERSAFYSCPIKEFKLPEGLKYIGMSAIYGTAVEHLEIPSSVDSIATFGCAWNEKMKTFRSGSGLRTLEDYALTVSRECDTIILNEGIRTIGKQAIASCYALKSFTIPSSVTAVGDSCFLKTQLDTLVNRAVTPQPLGSMITGDPWNGWQLYETMVLKVPENSIQAYKEADFWKLYKKIEGFKDFSGVENTMTDQETSVVEIYTLDGRRLSRLQPGINICRLSDGRFVKILQRE